MKLTKKDLFWIKMRGDYGRFAQVAFTHFVKVKRLRGKSLGLIDVTEVRDLKPLIERRRNYVLDISDLFRLRFTATQTRNGTETHCYLEYQRRRTTAEDFKTTDSVYDNVRFGNEEVYLKKFEER